MASFLIDELYFHVCVSLPRFFSFFSPSLSFRVCWKPNFKLWLLTAFYLFFFVAQDAAELRVQDIPKSHGGIIAVSQSGETRDTLKGESLGLFD